MNVAQLIVFQLTVRPSHKPGIPSDLTSRPAQEQVYLISFICTYVP